jgi:hypothetical protein
MRSTRLGLSLAALGLGTALATVSAFAQNYPIGRAANDGGMVTAQTQSPTGGQRTGSVSNDQAQRPSPGGDIYAFSGQGQPPAPASHYPVGRSANDGGIVTAQEQTPAPTGGQRTGSVSNDQAQRPGGDTYAFGAQGQSSNGQRHLFNYSPNAGQ